MTNTVRTEYEPSLGPLVGYRILDLTTSMSGPLATMILAEQGAEVIKIEAPGGDVIRRVGPGRDGMSGFFANLNRGKHSVVVDLANSKGRALLRRLAVDADVLVHNLRGGTAEHLGVDAPSLAAIAPRLIHVTISGFGSTGPRATDPAYDHLIQAVSGIAARQAEADGTPKLVRQGIVDKVTAYTAAQAVTAALLGRERTGQSEPITVSMLDSAVAFLWPDGMASYTCLEEVSDYGDIANSFRLASTIDGHVAVNVITDRQFRGLTVALGVEPDDRFDTVEGRGRHGGVVLRIMRDRLATMATDNAVALLREHGVPAAAVVSLADVSSSAAVRDAELIRTCDHPILGRIEQPRSAARFTGVGALGRPAPTLGQDTDAVLASAGYAAEEIALLREDGVVG